MRGDWCSYSWLCLTHRFRIQHSIHISIAIHSIPFQSNPYATESNSIRTNVRVCLMLVVRYRYKVFLARFLCTNTKAGEKETPSNPIYTVLLVSLFHNESIFSIVRTSNMIHAPKSMWSRSQYFRIYTTFGFIYNKHLCFRFSVETYAKLWVWWFGFVCRARAELFWKSSLRKVFCDGKWKFIQIYWNKVVIEVKRNNKSKKNVSKNLNRKKKSRRKKK